MYTPSWSPDDRWIEVSGNGAVLVDAATGDVRRINVPFGQWSTDGPRLLVPTGYPDALASIHVATDERQTIDGKRDGFSQHYSVWSHDGSRVASSAARKGISPTVRST